MGDYTWEVIPFGVAAMAMGCVLVFARRLLMRIGKGMSKAGSVPILKDRSETFWIRYSIAMGVLLLVFGALFIAVGGFVFADA